MKMTRFFMKAKIAITLRWALICFVLLLMLTSCFKESYEDDDYVEYYEEINAARAIGVKSNGKIIVAGYISRKEEPTNTMILAQYLENGDLDTSFGDKGIVYLNSESEDPGFSSSKILITEDNKIILSENFKKGNRNTLVSKYNSDGSPDLTFGTNGRVKYLSVGFTHMQLAKNGNILLSGTKYSSKDSFCIVQLTPEGEVDTAFHSGKLLTIGFSAYNAYCANILVQEDNKIMLTGYTDEDKSILPMARIHSDGSLDSTFHQDGQVLADIFYDYWGTFGVRQKGNGKYLLTGMGNLGVVIRVQINQDGSLDSNFGNQGIETKDYSFGSIVRNYYVEYLNNGNTIIAGNAFYHTQDIVIIGLLPSGMLDTGFGSSGWNVKDFSGENDDLNSIAFQDDGKILLAGEAVIFDYSDGSISVFFIIRYNQDGSQDLSFGKNGVVLTNI